MEVLTQDVNSIVSLGHNAILCLYGLEDNAGRGLRCVRAQMDTGDGEPSQLSFEEVSVNSVG